MRRPRGCWTTSHQRFQYSGQARHQSSRDSRRGPPTVRRSDRLDLAVSAKAAEQPDPELLKQLGWTQNDLREFIDRYQAARGLKAESRSTLTTEEELQRLNLADPDGSAIGPSGQADAFRQQLDGGGRSRPPERLRKQIEQFQRALQHSRP